MSRLKRHMYEQYGPEFTKDESYNAAYKKVKKIKGFYSHLKIYIIVNAIIIVTNLNKDFFGHNQNDYGWMEWHTYSTALYWGIGLLIHAFSVFGPDVFFNKDWEEKKIQKYMDKDAANTNKWK
jgi:2TM domain